MQKLVTIILQYTDETALRTKTGKNRNKTEYTFLDGQHEGGGPTELVQLD